MKSIKMGQGIVTLLAGLALLLSVIAILDQGKSAESASNNEARLQAVEDELAIRRVIVDYSATQDARNFEAYTALFAKEGEWVNGDTVHRGPQAILQMLVELYGEPDAGFENNESYHITSNPQIDVQGDRAIAHSRHLLIMRGPQGEPTPMLAGRYKDEFIREDGQWKILRREDHPVMPTREEWLSIIRGWQNNNDP